MALTIAALTVVGNAMIGSSSAHAGTTDGTLCAETDYRAPVYRMTAGGHRGAVMYYIYEHQVMRILGRGIDGELAGYYFGHGNGKADGLAWYPHFRGCPV